MFLLRLVAENWSIAYELNRNRIIQRWTKLRHFNWEFKESDLVLEDSYLIEFKLENGLITEENDKANQLICSYVYDEKNRLVRKEYRLVGENDVFPAPEYRYQGDTLIDVREYRNGELMDQHFSSSGLLDSTHTSDGGRIFYRYSYFPQETFCKSVNESYASAPIVTYPKE